jgi:hypothetical protein
MKVKSIKLWGIVRDGELVGDGYLPLLFPQKELADRRTLTDLGERSIRVEIREVVK